MFSSSKIKHYLIIPSVIIIISLIPVICSWNALVIGGDIIVPFNSSSLVKYFYQWLQLQNGLYFSINYFPLYLYYKITESIGLNIYQISSLLLFFLNLISGFGIYRLAKLFYAKEKPYIYLVPVVFYLLSPALLNGWHYIYIYSFIPWFFYFVFKAIKNKEIKITDLVWMNILLFFSSLDLPNPKYIFHLFLLSFLIFLFSYIFKLVNLKFFLKNSGKFIIFALLSVYLFLPLGYFATHYSPELYGVHVKTGYKDDGKMMDFGLSTIDKMFALHNNNLVLNSLEQKRYETDPLVILLGYSFIFLIIWNLFFIENKSNINKENYRIQLILFVLILIYLLFASGSNPPLGFVYEYVVSKFSLFAFLRTSAGAVFFLSPFYAVLLFGFVKNIKKFQPLIVFLLVIFIGIVGYPFLNGTYYNNVNVVNQYTNRNQHGFKIPDEYFRIKDLIDIRKLDAKILFPQTNLSYINTKWGYFGPVLYQFLYNSYDIGYDNIYSNINNHNVGFAFIDNSLIGANTKYNYSGATMIKDNFISFLTLKRSSFLPHFYTPQTIITTSQNINNLPDIVSQTDYKTRSAIYFNNTDQTSAVANPLANSSPLFNPKELKKETVSNTPVIEFKKINPTKYRVIIHHAAADFPLVFSESFNDGWKSYLEDYKKSPVNFNAADYKILDGNADDQAGAAEVQSFIGNGDISSLGDLKDKNIAHTKWEDNKEVLDYNESYKIDFISKNFQDTIQNDNLPNGRFYETWFQAPVDNNSNHKMVNGYANSWDIDPAAICQNNPKCTKNADGSYDMELVIEFWPQRLFYIGLFISGTTLIGCLGYLGWDFVKRRKRKNGVGKVGKSPQCPPTP